MAAIRCETRPYVISHGVEPRGWGLWMFRLRRGVLAEEYGFTGNYAVARRQAVQYAQHFSYDTVEVLP